MTESIDKIIELTDEELSEVSGGKEDYNKSPVKTTKECSRCLANGIMKLPMLKLDDYEFCLDGFHIYKNGKYCYSNKDEVSKLMHGKTPSI